MDKLVVTTYTREAKVLGKTWGRPVRLVCEGESKHFVGFARYLHQRGKVHSMRVGSCQVAAATL